LAVVPLSNLPHQRGVGEEDSIYTFHHSPPPAGAEPARFDSIRIQSNLSAAEDVVVAAAARARGRHGRAAEMHKSKLSGVLHKGFKPDKWSVQILLLP
jgi:hypothetical protein